MEGATAQVLQDSTLAGNTGVKEELHLIHEEPANKRRLTRREMVQRLLAGAGAGAAWPLVAASHPIHTHLANEMILSQAEATMTAMDWKPLFLDSHQNETLIALSESIVPGSGPAQVNRFIDLLLSVDTAANQKKFAAGIAAINSASQAQFGRPFPALQGDQQTTVLTKASEEEAKGERQKVDSSSAKSATATRAKQIHPTLRDHFEHLKGWIGGAYYSSEAGMKELGWTGDQAFESFPGCQHPDGHR